MRRLVGVLAYPALVSGTTAAAVVALDSGVPSSVTVGGAQLLAGVAVLGLERALPFERDWQRARDADLRTDLLHLFVSTLAVGGLVQALTEGPLARASAALTDVLGVSLWPDGAPLLAQLALALLVSELGLYGLHRLEHTVPWLVRLHEVHHGVSRLYFLNVARNHPLDTVFTFAVGIAPLLVLGAGERALVAYAALAGAHAFLQHANVDLRLGPLNRWLSLAEQHRFHHSTSLTEARGNYGSILLVWDHVFGTALTPPHASRPALVGAPGSRSVPPRWLAQLAHPFRRDPPSRRTETLR